MRAITRQRHSQDPLTSINVASQPCRRELIVKQLGIPIDKQFPALEDPEFYSPYPKQGALTIVINKQDLSLHLKSTCETLPALLQSLAHTSIDTAYFSALLKHLKPVQSLAESELGEKTDEKVHTWQFPMKEFNILWVHLLDLHFRLKVVESPSGREYTQIFFDLMEGARGWTPDAVVPDSPDPGVFVDTEEGVEQLQGLFRIIMLPSIKRVNLMTDYMELGFSSALIAAWPNFKLQKKIIVFCEDEIMRWQFTGIVMKLQKCLEKHPTGLKFEYVAVDATTEGQMISNQDPDLLTKHIIYLALIDPTRELIFRGRHNVKITCPVIFANFKGYFCLKFPLMSSSKLICIEKIIPDIKFNKKGGLVWGGKNRTGEVYPVTYAIPLIVQYLLAKMVKLEIDSFNQPAMFTKSELFFKRIPYHLGTERWSEQTTAFRYLFQTLKLTKVIIFLSNPEEKTLFQQSLEWSLEQIRAVKVHFVDLTGPNGSGIESNSETDSFVPVEVSTELSCPQVFIVLAPTNFTPYMLHFFNPQAIMYWYSKNSSVRRMSKGLMLFLKASMKRLNLVHIVLNRPKLIRAIGDLKRDFLIEKKEVDKLPQLERADLSGTFIMNRIYSGPLRIWKTPPDVKHPIFPSLQILTDCNHQKPKPRIGARQNLVHERSGTDSGSESGSESSNSDDSESSDSSYPPRMLSQNIPTKPEKPREMATQPIIQKVLERKPENRVPPPKILAREQKQPTRTARQVGPNRLSKKEAAGSVNPQPPSQPATQAPNQVPAPILQFQKLDAMMMLPMKHPQKQECRLPTLSLPPKPPAVLTFKKLKSYTIMVDLSQPVRHASKVTRLEDPLSIPTLQAAASPTSQAKSYSGIKIPHANSRKLEDIARKTVTKKNLMVRAETSTIVSEAMHEVTVKPTQPNYIQRSVSPNPSHSRPGIGKSGAVTIRSNTSSSRPIQGNQLSEAMKPSASTKLAQPEMAKLRNGTRNESPFSFDQTSSQRLVARLQTIRRNSPLQERTEIRMLKRRNETPAEPRAEPLSLQRMSYLGKRIENLFRQ